MFQKIGVVNSGWISKLWVDIFKACFQILACTMRIKSYLEIFLHLTHHTLLMGKLTLTAKFRGSALYLFSSISINVRSFRFRMLFCVIPTFVATNIVVFFFYFNWIADSFNLFILLNLCSKTTQILCLMFFFKTFQSSEHIKFHYFLTLVDTFTG